MSDTGGPLSPLTSIKVKLGVLVAASVAVATVLATVGAAGRVPPWLSIPVTVALALGVTQLLAIGMTSPLRQMTIAAGRMARGDYSRRIVAASRDEVGELAAAFNTMAADLATVDRERRDLLANVSHELRTPLTALGARLENLADGVEEPTAETLAQLLEQTRRLGALVADLLDLSRLDAGIRPLQTVPVDLASLLTEVAADVSGRSRRAHFEVSVSPEGLTVPADPGRLRQLATNLLDNAARHSPADASVTVTAASRPGSPALWVLEVSDQGPGVAPSDRERVFERFGTLAGHEGGGTGLGLAIARWIAELHGGTLRFVDPPRGEPGARMRLELPLDPPPRSTPLEAAAPPPTATGPASSAPPRPAAAPAAPRVGMEALFGAFWPERGVPARRDLLAAAVATGVLAGVLLPFRAPGLGTLMVLAAAGGTVLLASRHRRDAFTLTCAALCAVLASTVLLRDAEWIVALCVVTGAGLLAVAVTRGRTAPGFVLAALAWPLAGLRGLPWLGRTSRGLAGRGNAPAVLRTALWSGAALVVFGLLFASADALFAHWLGVLVPDWSVDTLVLRVFVGVFVAGVVLAAAYLALNPPRVDADGTAGRRPVQNRYEWLTPVLLVDVVFLAFLAAQATVFFGGHEYLQRTTGLTYAEYVHQGFGQLTVATALTLLVVWAAGRKAAVDRPGDRLWLRGSLGLLLILTLVVVASALYRMHLYQEAYGFTRLRLLVDVFEGWLGLVVVTVLVAGITLSARWLPRVALLSGAAALAGLALVNPDAWIAQQNIERYESTGKIDTSYLSGLSADALPVLWTLPEDVRDCALAGGWESDDDLWSWNLGRARARQAIGADSLPAPEPLSCPGDLS